MGWYVVVDVGGVDRQWTLVQLGPFANTIQMDDRLKQLRVADCPISVLVEPWEVEP